VRRKDKCWTMGPVYIPSWLLGVMTARLEELGVLQVVTELTLTGSQAHIAQLGIGVITGQEK
jgi:hypothetical protein